MDAMSDDRLLLLKLALEHLDWKASSGVFSLSLLVDCPDHGRPKTHFPSEYMCAEGEASVLELEKGFEEEQGGKILTMKTLHLKYSEGEGEGERHRGLETMDLL
jgi:hypothetical protein